MNTPNTSDTTPKKKLSPIGFDLAVNTHLDGTNMGGLLTNVKLEVDENGKIKENVIENVKMTLKVALDMSDDEILKQKMGKLKEFLKDY